MVSKRENGIEVRSFRRKMEESKVDEREDGMKVRHVREKMVGKGDI